VFAVKSILANHAPAAASPRALNRTDWIDAIKNATVANIAGQVVPSSGVDLSYAYKIPFQFPWDIVICNGERTPVAP
jgi:hypothetical protein